MSNQTKVVLVIVTLVLTITNLTIQHFAHERKQNAETMQSISDVGRQVVDGDVKVGDTVTILVDGEPVEYTITDTQVQPAP